MKIKLFLLLFVGCALQGMEGEVVKSEPYFLGELFYGNDQKLNYTFPCVESRSDSLSTKEDFKDSILSYIKINEQKIKDAVEGWKLTDNDMVVIGAIDKQSKKLQPSEQFIPFVNFYSNDRVRLTMMEFMQLNQDEYAIVLRGPAALKEKPVLSEKVYTKRDFNQSEERIFTNNWLKNFTLFIESPRGKKFILVGKFSLAALVAWVAYKNYC